MYSWSSKPGHALVSILKITLGGRLDHFYSLDYSRRHILGFNMMTSPNGNIFRVTDSLCGEFTGHPVNSPHKGQWRGALMFSLIWAWINGWVNNRDAGNLRRQCTHYAVTITNRVSSASVGQHWSAHIGLYSITNKCSREFGHHLAFTRFYWRAIYL